MGMLRVQLAVAAAAVLLGGCEYFADGGGGAGNEVVDVCRRYEKALQDADWQTARGLLTGPQLQQWDRIWRAAQLDSRLIKTRSTKYQDPTIDGETAVVRAIGTNVYKRPTEASMGQTKLVLEQEVTLKKVDGAWKIHSILTLARQ
jgi:hypothetical protein